MDTIKDEKYWAEEAEKCKEFHYFYNNYVMIKGKDGNTFKPEPITKEHHEALVNMAKNYKQFHRRRK